MPGPTTTDAPVRVIGGPISDGLVLASSRRVVGAVLLPDGRSVVAALDLPAPGLGSLPFLRSVRERWLNRFQLGPHAWAVAVLEQPDEASPELLALRFDLGTAIRVTAILVLGLVVLAAISTTLLACVGLSLSVFSFPYQAAMFAIRVVSFVGLGLLVRTYEPMRQMGRWSNAVYRAISVAGSGAVPKRRSLAEASPYILEAGSNVIFVSALLQGVLVWAGVSALGDSAPHGSHLRAHVFLVLIAFAIRPVADGIAGELLRALGALQRHPRGRPLSYLLAPLQALYLLEPSPAMLSLSARALRRLLARDEALATAHDTLDERVELGPLGPT
jgi:uncharacterized protein YqhQ